MQKRRPGYEIGVNSRKASRGAEEKSGGKSEGVGLHKAQRRSKPKRVYTKLNHQRPAIASRFYFSLSTERSYDEVKILVACEESQAVTIELRKLGHEAYSCDIEPCSGGHPEWHLQQDVIPLLKEKWDMIIAFPPCTYLTVTGNRWFNIERYGEKAIKRHKDREEAIKFFMAFANADCEKIAIENPIGVMSTIYRKPNQIIHPYMFGDPERKGTCLWLKGLPELKPTNIVEPNIITYKNGKGTDSPWHMNTMGLPKEERAKLRSKTFPGIAKAMAEQWAGRCGE